MHRVPIPPPPPPYCLASSSSRGCMPATSLCDHQQQQQPSVSMLASSRDFSHRVKMTERLRNQILLNLDAHDRALWRQAEGPVSTKGISRGTEGCYFRECAPPYDPFPRRGGCYKVMRRIPEDLNNHRSRIPGGGGPGSNSPAGRDEISIIPFGVLACLELDTMEEPPMPQKAGRRRGGTGSSSSSTRGGSSSDWERSTEASSSSSADLST